MKQQGTVGSPEEKGLGLSIIFNEQQDSGARKQGRRGNCQEALPELTVRELIILCCTEHGFCSRTQGTYIGDSYIGRNHAVEAPAAALINRINEGMIKAAIHPLRCGGGAGFAHGTPSLADGYNKTFLTSLLPAEE